MKEGKDLTRFAGWIVPGWVCILTFFTFLAVDTLFSTSSSRGVYKDLWGLLNDISVIGSAWTAVLVIAAGFPLGFCIYQIYFFLRWNSPFSRDGFYSPFIIGRMRDLERIKRGITPDELSLSQAWRKEWITHPLFKRDHGFQWRYIELLLNEAIQKIDTRFGGGSVSIRHRYLHEVVHTLGSSLGGVYFGFLGYFFMRYHKGCMPSLPLCTLVSLGSIWMLLSLLGREDATRDELERQTLSDSPSNSPIWVEFGFKKIRLRVTFPGARFGVLLGLVHFWANPKLNPSPFSLFDIALQVIATAIFIFIWIRRRTGMHGKLKTGDNISLLLSCAFAILFRVIVTKPPLAIYGSDLVDAGFKFIADPLGVLSYLFSIVGWPFFTVLSMFLIANLLLLRNRKNAQDDMIELENYTLKRHLKEGQGADQEKPETSPNKATTIEKLDIKLSLF